MVTKTSTHKHPKYPLLTIILTRLNTHTYFNPYQIISKNFTTAIYNFFVKCFVNLNNLTKNQLTLHNFCLSYT